MDWELIFWVVAPFVAVIAIIGYLALRDVCERKNCEWKREHADDFNKDLWEGD